jgi:hypothetical protein
MIRVIRIIRLKQRVSGYAISLLTLCCFEKVLPWILSKSLKVLRSQVICVCLCMDVHRRRKLISNWGFHLWKVLSCVDRRRRKGGGGTSQSCATICSMRFHTLPPSPFGYAAKGKIRTETVEMARSVHSWDTGVVCHCDTSCIHIRKGEFLLGEFTICIKQVQLNGSSLVFKFDNYHWNFKSRYFTGFGCSTVTCTEFVLIRLLMVIEWWDWEHLVTLRPG